MARGRRRAAVAPAVMLQPEDLAAGAGSGGEDQDVDDFVAERHRKLAEAAAGDESVEDDGSDLGIGAEAGVMDIAVSDSEDDEDADSESDESSTDADATGDEDTQWGGRRRAWYGGDTHEYEIMEDDEREEALAEEEAEARRLQAKALSGMAREDFVDSDGESADGEDGRDKDPKELLGARPLRGADVTAAAPELPALLCELRTCLHELPALRTAAGDTAGRGGAAAKRARIRAHVLTAYATNVAFYLALRTDPDAADVDVRAHPVIREIVGLRALAETCKGLGMEGQGVAEEEKGVACGKPGTNGVGESGEADTTAVGADGGRAGVAAPEALPSMEQVLAVDGDDGGDPVAAEPVVKKKKKRGKQKRKGQAAAVTTAAVDSVVSAPDVAEEEAAFMRKVVGEQETAAVDDAHADREKERESAAKRRKLNRVVGALERDRQSKALRRVAPADMQTIRQEPAPPKATRVAPDKSACSVGESDENGRFASRGGDDAEDDLFGSDGGGGADDDEVLMARMLAQKAKKERKAARKSEAEAPHHYSFDDSIKDKSLRRRASSQVVHNRGLTRYRPKDRKTPRAKNREAFGKAVKKRRSVVRDPVAAKPSSYGGEASGINMRAIKSSRLADV